jgi:ribosomal protein S18 acetylase RimI-like enzyme
VTRVGVRHAREEDFDALAEVLARAFADDPVTAWFFPGARTRLARARRLFVIRLRQLAPQGAIFTTADHAGAALWAMPARWREDGQALRALLPAAPVILPRPLRALRASARIDAHHPAEPHFYLSVLGTDPGRRGEGVGSALLEPVLARCDVERRPAYLEASRERNVAFYERHGFAVRTRIELPGGGPPLWLMWRPPRP